MLYKSCIACKILLISTLSWSVAGRFHCQKTNHNVKICHLNEPGFLNLVSLEINSNLILIVLCLCKAAFC